MASERFGSSGWSEAHFSIAFVSSAGSRRAVSGSFPVAGRPRFFLGITLFDFAIYLYNLKTSRGEVVASAPALTPAMKALSKMTKVDSVHSTPPTNTSAILGRYPRLMGAIMTAPFLRIVAGAAHVDQPATSPDGPGISYTPKNKRLRDQRRHAWHCAEAGHRYWEARLQMESTVSVVQRWSLPEGNLHSPHVPNERWEMLAKWRAAIARQMLTPAPDTAAIAWKRAAFRAGHHVYTDLKPEMIERAIASDVAFLDAHPTRRKA